MIPVPTTYLQWFIKLALILCKLSHDPNNGEGIDTSSQYGDHFCQIVVMILLVKICLNTVIIFVK